MNRLPSTLIRSSQGHPKISPKESNCGVYLSLAIAILKDWRRLFSVCSIEYNCSEGHQGYLSLSRAPLLLSRKSQLNHDTMPPLVLYVESSLICSYLALVKGLRDQKGMLKHSNQSRCISILHDMD